MAVGLQRALMIALLALSAPVWAAKKVDLDYHVRLLPQSDQAEVRLTLAQGSAVRSLDFDLADGSRYSDFKADGQWQLTPGKATRGIWRPAADKASLTYRVRISQPRKNNTFETRMTPSWALLRGDDLVPAARLDQQDGIELVSRLAFELPSGWKSVETAWPRIGKNRFRVDNVSRLFDRPTGWMLAGNLGTRRTRLGETEVTVAAPVGQARTQAGPPASPLHMSHLTAIFLGFSSPSCFLVHLGEGSPGPGPRPSSSQLKRPGLGGGVASMRITP